MSSTVEDIKIVDNVFVKMMSFPSVGDTHDGHSHSFDHITLLSSGAVKMVHEKGEQDFIAPHLIVTPKGTKHQFIATQPNTLLCCIHAIREGDDVDDIAPQNISFGAAVALINKYKLSED